MSKTKDFDPLARRLASVIVPNWNDVWAAWCPACHQECMPMPSGRCGFCNTSLLGQPTRNWNEPPLEEGRLAARDLRVATTMAA